MNIAEHNTRVFYWARMLDAVRFLEPVIALFYLSRGLAPSQILLIWIVMASTNLLAEVPTGAFADRFGPKVAFATGAAFRLAGTALLLLPAGPWSIFVSAALTAFGWTFYSGAESAVIYESLKENGEQSRMAAVWGRIESAGFLPRIAAYLVGPLLARDLTPGQFQLLILLDAAVLAARLAVMLGVRSPRSFDANRENPFAHVANAVRVVRRNPGLFMLAVNSTLVFIPTAVFTQFDQPYLTGAGLPVPYLGLLYAGGSVVCWFLANQIGWLTTLAPRTRLALVTGIINLVALAAAALIQSSVSVAILVFFLLRMSQVVRSPIIGELQNEYIPSEGRATALSLLQLMDSGMDLLVVPVIAAVSGLGFPVIFAASAAVVLIGLLIPVREAPAL